MRAVRRFCSAFVVCGCALFLAACGSTAEADLDGEGPAIVEQPTSTAAQATAEAEANTPRLEGEVTDPFALGPGDCFNDYSWFDRAKNRQTATTRIFCGKRHESQVYFVAEHPAPEDQPFVGEPELRAYTQDLCYKNFEDFVGNNYEQSALQIGLRYPDLTAWGTEFDRSLQCYVYAFEGGLLRGSMAATGL